MAEREVATRASRGPGEACIYCRRTESQVPLVTWRYRGQEFFLCPEHLPFLIHAPEELAELLPSLPGAPDTTLD